MLIYVVAGGFFVLERKRAVIGMDASIISVLFCQCRGWKDGVRKMPIAATETTEEPNSLVYYILCEFFAFLEYFIWAENDFNKASPTILVLVYSYY